MNGASTDHLRRGDAKTEKDKSQKLSLLSFLCPGHVVYHHGKHKYNWTVREVDEVPPKFLACASEKIS